MNSESSQLHSSALLAIVGSILLFIISSLSIEGSVSAGSIVASGGILMLAVVVTQSSSVSKLMQVLRLGSVVFGVAFWGMGWMMMLMMEATVGWWIFICGWTLLSLGLISYGAADIQKRNLPSWATYMLLVGILPVIVEFAVPYHFATAVIPITQLLIMFAYSFGWVLMGRGLSVPSPAQEKQRFKTQQTVVQQSSASA